MYIYIQPHVLDAPAVPGIRHGRHLLHQFRTVIPNEAYICILIYIYMYIYTSAHLYIYIYIER